MEILFGTLQGARFPHAAEEPPGLRPSPAPLQAGALGAAPTGAASTSAPPLVPSPGPRAVGAAGLETVGLETAGLGKGGPHGLCPVPPTRFRTLSTRSMASSPIGLLVGLAGLAGGALALLARGLRANRHPWHHLLAFLVPAATALSYTAMLFGQGVTVLSTGRVYYWARWADALFGATVLVVNTALVALPRSSARRGALLAGLAASNVLTMASGLFAGFSTQAAARWTWYAIGSGSYTAVLWILFRRVPQEARRQNVASARRRIFWRLSSFLIGVALLYPLWWVATPLGVGWVGHETALLVFAGLDIVSKAVYGWLLVRAVHRIPKGPPRRHASPRESAPSRQQMGAGEP